MFHLRWSVLQAQLSVDLPRLVFIPSRQLGGRLAVIVLGLQYLVSPWATARRFYDNLSGLRLAKASRGMKRVFAMQACQHRLRGAAIIALE